MEISLGIFEAGPKISIVKKSILTPLNRVQGSQEARESIVKKLVNEMAHAAAGSVKERSGSHVTKPRDSSDSHVVVKKSEIERSGHEVVKRSSLSEEEIVNMSDKKDVSSSIDISLSYFI